MTLKSVRISKVDMYFWTNNNSEFWKRNSKL